MSKRSAENLVGEFVLRPIKEDHLAELLEVYRECEDFLALGPLARATEEMVLSDLRLSEEEGGTYCGIYIKGELVGLVDYQLSHHGGDPKTGYISLIMIARAWRGRGLGRSVVEEVESRILRTEGVGAIKVSVQSNNPRSISFWEGLGYRIVGGPMTMPDATTVFVMRKGDAARIVIIPQ